MLMFDVNDFAHMFLLRFLTDFGSKTACGEHFVCATRSMHGILESSIFQDVSDGRELEDFPFVAIPQVYIADSFDRDFQQAGRR